ncbi:hypothetical protein BDV93DRAFT_443842 [Ceratobasidium sp. AG-I]|nr:hypothetical protein BDV93DRAFT_443842 [Ceratobasidium sp. AG-I]
MEQRHVTEQEAKNQAQARQQAESSQQAQAAQAHRIAILSSVLETSLGVLNSNGLDLSDFLVYVFDPSSKLGNLRSAQFWRRPEQFWLLMRHWLARGATESGKELVKIFAIDLVTRIARSEAQKATRSGFLKSPLECVSPETAGELSLESLISQLEKECSTMFTILTGFCTSRSHQKAPTEVRSNHRRKIVAITAMSLLRQYNRMNNKFQTLSSLFLYASGVTRQGVSVISSYGNSISYTKLIARPPATRNPASGDASLVAKKLRRTGTLFNLSQACRELTQSIAKAHPVGIIYDNINLTFRVAEQRLGRADTFESGTCATVFKLFKASPEDMQVSDLITSFKNAPGLTLGDLQLLPEEASLHQRCLIHTLLDIIVTHGGSLFEKYQGLLSSQLPVSQYKRELHIDAIHPLPTMDIEEGTVKGNIEICANIFKELGFDTSNLEFQKMVWLLAGDQQTIARLRAIAKNRMGHEAGYESFEWLTQVIGLFHLKMAQTKGVLETHLGRTNSSRNPTCLAFQNTLIHRKPIPSPAPFYLARDLIRVSLYARVLDCLLLVSGAPDLSTLAQQLAESDLPQPSNPPHSRSFAQLEKYAQTIYAKYASRINVYKLRQERNAAAGKLAAGDMIYEDSCLFICDALDLESFISAVKAGDSGRVLILLKLWSCAFRASGHPKYAQEMLFLIHNIEHVWPPALRDIVFNNWLLNPTGKPNSHVELDLVQEHLIYWIKTVYKAHGSNASWEWLANISPCVAVLRKLAREFHQSLGVDQGVQHSPVELAQSISTLMRSFNTNAVHTIKVGRNREKSDGAPVVDTLSEGMRRLVHGTNDPIAEFNLSLKQLQQRCQLTPITYGASQSLMQPSDINMDNVLVSSVFTLLA